MSTTRLILLPGTLCDHRLFGAVARRLRPRVAVRTAHWRELLRANPPLWMTGPEPLNLLGFSLGGIWALHRLSQLRHHEWPLPLERLALVGSNAEAAGPGVVRRTREQRQILRRLGTAAMARSVKGRYFARRPPKWQARLVLDMARRTPRGLALRQLELAATRPDGLEAFAAFPGPVAIMSGRRDPLCPPSAQQRLALARGDARHEAWADCGHMIPLEAPGRLARAILRWLAVPAPIPPSSSGVRER